MFADLTGIPRFGLLLAMTTPTGCPWVPSWPMSLATVPSWQDKQLRLSASTWVPAAANENPAERTLDAAVCA